MSWVPMQVEEEPGWSHLQEEHKESARSAAGEAAPLRTLGLARGKPPSRLSVLSVLHPVHPLTKRTPVTCDYSLDSSGLCPWLLMTEPRTWQVFRP